MDDRESYARQRLSSPKHTPSQLDRPPAVTPMVERMPPMAAPVMDDVVKTILAEAAGEGEEGMYAVASVIANRAKQRGKTPAQIVNEPYQFAGRARPDLDRFVQLQRPEVQQAASRAWMRALQQPMPEVDHYISQGLYESPRRPSWVQRLTPRGRIGNHVFFSSSPTSDGASHPTRRSP